MPQVQMPDGNIIELPDNPTPEQKVQIQRLLTQAKQKEPSTLEKISSAVKGGLSDLGRGAIKGVGGALDMIETQGQVRPQRDEQGRVFWQGPGGQRIYGSEADQRAQDTPTFGSRLQGFAEDILPTPKDSSAGGRFVRAGLEGVGGAISGGPTKAVNMVSGGTAGLAGQAAEEYSPGNGFLKLLAQITGGVAGGAATGRATAARPQAAELAREAMEGLTPEILQRAQAFQADQLARGVKIDLAQALEGIGVPASNLTTIRDRLAQSRHGTEVQRTLRNQPTQLAAEAERVTAAIPGRVVPPQEAANKLQETATGVIAQATNQRKLAWETALDESREALRQSAQAKVAGAQGIAEGARGKVVELEQQLSQAQKVLEAARSGDQAAVAAANAKVAEVQGLIQKLSSFALPRGNVTGNTGRFLDPAKRGEAIDFDLINREVQANTLRSTLPQPVTPAPSLETLQAQKAVGGVQAQLTAVEQQAQQAQQALRTARGELQAVDVVPAKAMQDVVDYLGRRAAEYPNTAQSAELLRLSRRLQTADGFVTDPKAVNQILKEAAARLKSPDLSTKGIDAGTAKFLGSEIGTVRERLGATFEPLREANAVYKAATEGIINPLRKSVVGRIAGPRGALPDVEAAQARMTSLFENGVDPSSKVSEIRTLGEKLAKQDPDAFRDAFKTWLSGKVQSVMKPGVEDVLTTDPKFAQSLDSAVFGSVKQWQGIKDAMTVQAKLSGQDPGQVLQGLDNLRRLVRGAASRPQSVGGLSYKDTVEIAGKSKLADSARIFGFLPFEKVARRLEDSATGTTFRQFDEILTTPEGARVLAELSKVPIMSRKAQTLLGTFYGIQGTEDPQQFPGNTGQ